MAQGETETLKCLVLTFPRWEQGERGDSLQKELSEKPQRNVCKGEPAAKGNRPKVIVEISENYVYGRALLLVCSSAKQFSK